MRKTLIVAVICVGLLIVSGIALALWSGRLKTMEYQIEDSGVGQLSATLNSRVTGYAALQDSGRIKFLVYLDENHSGAVDITLNHKSKTLHYRDEVAHLGGKAWLRIKDDRIELKYIQLNYF